MRILFPLVAVVVLIVIGVLGVGGAHLNVFFGVIIPYAALITFLAGVVYRVVTWARSPQPFCIPTTAGQQKSLPWIKQDKLENPSSTMHVIGRMFLEVFFFRSLFRNLKTEMTSDNKVVYGSAKWLWLAGLAFHYSFLVVLLRHIRFFAQPAPFFLPVLEALDGFLQIGIPRLFLTGVVLLAAVTYLLLRRLYIPQVRYISLAADYFPLFLIMAIASTGILMRYFLKTDVVGIKTLTMGLVTFHPVIPEGVGTIFYVHLLLVSVLFAYFPFSKLVHMGGVFLSPTRNLQANSREFRYVNPWNYPVHVHTYEEYENDFRDKMKMAEIPVEKE
ncbi:MAG: sulfate reduction electron transfer complex DsrMKJOP subunit DsrM [Nitrospirota bacterium]